MLFSRLRVLLEIHAAKDTARKKTTHQLRHTGATKGPAYILKTENSSFLIKEILTPEDIGRNLE
jgi:adenylosuccinate synthase